jgi:hypothetical protein
MVIINRDWRRRLSTDNLLGSLSFSELLFSLWVSSLEGTGVVGDFLRRQGYRCDSLEDLMHRMISLENEDFELATNRVLYLSLLSLKNIGWTREDEESRNLSDTVDYLCSTFPYLKGAEYISYIWALPFESDEWLQNRSPEKHLKNCPEWMLGPLEDTVLDWQRLHTTLWSTAPI